MTSSAQRKIIPIRSGAPPGPAAATAEGTVTVGLVQINNSFSGQNYLPYSTACLEGYIRQKASTPSRYSFLSHIYKRMPVRDAVEQLLPADVVGFSTYVWNAQISL